jgi:1-acyl-sn-glycerol-3-phosphate acyltransferase
VLRLPFFVAAVVGYFLVLQWLPLGVLARKLFLWMIIAIPGIWWVDIRVDGVKKGSIARHSSRLPQPGSVIAASFTSPIDALYLAAVFDPIFTTSYPATRQVERISLLGAILRAFLPPQVSPPKTATLIDLKTLVDSHPHRVIAVFPECTTSNGKGILPFSPSLLSVPQKRRIYPINLRYAPGDITTPIPWSYMTFLWNLLSRPTHSINVRIAEYIDVRDGEKLPTLEPEIDNNSSEQLIPDLDNRVLDLVGESLARIGRVKRVALGGRDKADFIDKWNKR